MFQTLPLFLLTCQLALAVVSWVRPCRRFLLLGGSIVGGGCLYLTGFVLQEVWYVSVPTLLYIAVGAVQGFYVLFSLLNRQALWRIGLLCQPVLFFFLAVAYGGGSFFKTEGFLVAAPALQWHVLSATLAYGVLTLAALLAFAIIMRQAYLKAQTRSTFVANLPSLEVLEHAQTAALWVSFVFLVFATLAGGMHAAQVSGGHVFIFGGKTFLTVLTFALVGTLIVGKRVCGVRGRQGARLVLMAYVLVIILFLLGVPNF